MYIIKFDLSTFIKDLVIEKRLIKCNANIISMKARSIIKILDIKDYNK